MTYLSFDDKNGKLKALQVLPTLPDTYTGEGQASASLLSKMARFSSVPTASMSLSCSTASTRTLDI